MKPSVTVTAPHLGMLVQFGAARGLDVPSFLAWLDVDPAVVTDPEARIPHEKFAAALDEIPRRVNAPNLGLELSRIASQKSPHADFSMLTCVANSSATVGAAFENVIRYLRIIHDAAAIRFETRGDEARIFIQPLLPIYLPRHAHEFMIAVMLHQGRRLSGETWNPRVVRFAHPEPSDTTLHQEIFRAPLEFGSPVSEMLFDRAIVERPLLSADPTLQAVLERYAQKLSERLPRLDSPTDQVRQSVARMMSEGVPDIRRVARDVATSVRSLQRFLSAEGLTFRRLIDDVRRELALRHVAERKLTLLEIAFVLGFSDSTTFHRAFRRWTGMAPGEFREASERRGGRVSQSVA